MILSRAEAKENLAKLVEKFEKETSSGRINDYNEEATKTAFIQPLLRNVLGWNVSIRDEVSPEEKVSRGRVDYGLKIEGQIKLFIEVKPPRADLDKHIKQAVGYGYNRKGVPFVLLTDFEGLKLFDVTIKPDTRNPLKGLKIDLDWKEYLSEFDKIWLLSKESVLNGELDKLLLKKPKDRLPVDKAILDDLKEWREKLAKDIFKNNPQQFHAEDREKDADYLKEITQRIIDRIMFMRSCEDRKLIHRRSLRDLFEERTETVGTNTMVFLKEEFKHYNIIFDSDLFRPQDWETNLAIDFKVMKDIILDTYNPYQFDVIPLEVLGNMYEQYLGYTIRLTDHQVKYELKPDVRKAGGVYYTPEYIVDYIVKNTVGKLLQELSAKKIKKLRILDPACGSGSFLIRVYEEMLNYYRSQKKKKSKLKKEQEKLDLEHEIAEPLLTIEEKARILQEHIFGVDIDEQAVEVTKLSLMLKMLEGEFGIIPGRSILPMLDKNIRCGNSLISGETLELKKYFGNDWYKVKAFNWKDAFRKIMVEEGGFDVVIGNPPYVRIQTLNEFAPKQVKYFNEKYSAYIVGSYDIYLLFIYTGFNLLRKRGSLGYIVPHKFFQAEMGERIRKYIYQNKLLFKVIDFSTNQIFENATTYTCLLFLTNDVNNKILYKRFNLNDNMENLQNVTFEEMDIEILNEKTWVFSTDLARIILGKIYSQKNKFSEITNKIFKGSSTGNDNVFLLNMVKEQNKYYLLFSKQLNKNIKLEKDLLVPFLYGKDIKRYKKPEDRVILLFPYRYDEKGYKLIPLEDLKREYPLTYEYLKSVKDTLIKRKIPLSNANYYKYSASRSLNEYKTPKIMIPDMLVKNRISYDEKGVFFHGPAIHSVIFSDKVKGQHELFYLAILNSKLFWFFISNTSTALRENAYRLTPEFINPFCFPKINLNNNSQKLIHDKLVALAEVMFDLNKKMQTAKGSRKDQIQRQIEKTDKEIDDLVYKLYGITVKEREIIEGKV
ncbi:N-6 DNA methylase [candidate division WOR-3 bacterium]|nr:N-6 DNA methylase [candidate division WOR-3 bacterium]